MSRIVVWMAMLTFLLGATWGCGQPAGNPGGNNEKAVSKLVIQGPHSALWMPIDNAHLNAGDSRWDGVLIQIGRARYGVHGEEHVEPGPMHFKGVRFEGEGGSVDLYPDVAGAIPFGWINIVGENPGHEAPMSFADSRLLYPTDATTGCTEAEAGDTPKPCLRLRSLSQNLLPEAIITYWQGPSGYSFDAEQVDPQPEHFKDPHNLFTFHLKDAVKVEIYAPGSTEQHLEDKEAEIAALGSPLTITIRSSHFEEVPDHGEVHEPPIYWEGI